MEKWTQIVAKNILPLSVASTLPEAFKEWNFTGQCEDHGAPVETCQLCEQEQLRYHFEIQNAHTRKVLQVGSVCIERFKLTAFVNNRTLTAAETKRLLAQLLRKMQVDACIKALEKLAAAENNAILTGALEYYRQHKELTPKQANVVAWRFEVHNIERHASFFKIALRRDSHKRDLLGMPAGRIHRLWPYLSPAQRKWALNHGIVPPPPP